MLKSWDDQDMPDSCVLAFSLLQLVLFGQPVLSPTPPSQVGPSAQNAYKLIPLICSMTPLLKICFYLGKSIHKICINFFILKSIAFINQILMFPALINLTSTKLVLQNLPCLSWPNLSNKKGQNLSSKFLNTTTSNLYIKVLALCIFLHVLLYCACQVQYEFKYKLM